MALTVPRISTIHGRQPFYENSGYNQSDVNDDGTFNKAVPTYPEMQPYAGFTNQHCYANIAGQELTGFSPDHIQGTGPLEGDLMIMFLHVRNGYYYQFGQWEPVGALTYWQVSSILPDGPVPAALGTWTEFARADYGGFGPKVVAYWKIATAAEANHVVRWRIRLNPGSDRIFSNVTINFIRKGFFRTPFAPTINKRAVVLVKQFSIPGVTTPDSPDVDTSIFNFQGGNLVISSSTIMGPYDTTTRPDQGIWVSPGTVPGKLETWGGYYRYDYDGFWNYGLANLWTYGVADNLTVPDSSMNIQKSTAREMNYSGLTIAIPSPPNITMPTSNIPLGSYTNDFETNNLNSFFTVKGSGTPVLG